MRSLKGHGHWVNTLALSTEYALRTGAFDHTASAPADPTVAQAQALKRCFGVPILITLHVRANGQCFHFHGGLSQGRHPQIRMSCILSLPRGEKVLASRALKCHGQLFGLLPAHMHIFRRLAKPRPSFFAPVNPSPGLHWRLGEFQMGHRSDCREFR